MIKDGWKEFGECSLAPTEPVRVYFCNYKRAASINGTIGSWRLSVESFYDKGSFFRYEYKSSDYNIEIIKLKAMLILKELGWDIKSVLV